MGRLDDYVALKELTDRGSLKTYRGIPENNGGFTPDDGLMTCREHIQHLSLVERYILRKIIDALNLQLDFPEVDSTDSITTEIDTLIQTWQLTGNLLAKMQDDDLDKTIKLEEENIQVDVRHLLHVLVEHQVHHRGEMVVYIRAMGLVPPKRWAD
ncbi:MAG: DinB family protein [FCB group bacterium]|nr:DinB family protein [FCB group bacterium]